MLPQGELAQFHNSEQPIHYLAFIELRAGTQRGNHFHRIKQEFIYLLSGEVRLIVEEIESKARDIVPLQTGDLVFIPTGVAHTLDVVKTGQAIEFSEARFDPADIHRYPLS